MGIVDDMLCFQNGVMTDLQVPLIVLIVQVVHLFKSDMEIMDLLTFLMVIWMVFVYVLENHTHHISLPMVDKKCSTP